MPRRSAPSRSNSSTARSTAQAKVAPPNQTGQVARSGMAGGLMGSLMSGMAFGAGAEMFRQLFRNPTTGSLMMPLMLSGLTAFGAHRFLLTPGPYKGLYTAAVFGGTFIVSKSVFGGSSDSMGDMH